MNLNTQQKQKLTTLFPELREWLEQRETNEILKSFVSSIPLVKGEKGDKGDKGDIGYSPVKGKDYFTDQEINLISARILELATPIKGEHYFDGEDGKDYILTPKDKRDIASKIEVPIVEKVVEKIEVIKEVMPKKIDVSIVDGAVSKKELETTAKRIENGMHKVDGRMKLIDQRWHGAGLSKVIHDTTLTGDGTGSNPLSVIPGAGFLGTQEKSTTVPNGVLITFSFAHTPKLIMYNGQFQNYINNPTFDDITISGNSITFLNGIIPITGDKIVNIYQ